MSDNRKLKIVDHDGNILINQDWAGEEYSVGETFDVNGVAYVATWVGPSPGLLHVIAREKTG